MRSRSGCRKEGMMANPVVVEAMRGDLIESAHRGAGAVVDADGRAVMAFGDADRPVYPRSAVKALQALPLVESGAADSLGLSDKEIALALRVPLGQRRPCRNRARHARQGWPRRTRARMRRSLAARRGRGARAGALGRSAERAAQQLLGQARWLRLPFLRHGSGAEGLCRAGLIRFSAKSRRRSRR